jgi:hypothetical protein
MLLDQLSASSASAVSSAVDSGGVGAGSAVYLSSQQLQHVRMLLERTRAECDECYCDRCYKDIHSGGKRATHRSTLPLSLPSSLSSLFSLFSLLSLSDFLSSLPLVLFCVLYLCVSVDGLGSIPRLPCVPFVNMRQESLPVPSAIPAAPTRTTARPTQPPRSTAAPAHESSITRAARGNTNSRLSTNPCLRPHLHTATAVFVSGGWGQSCVSSARTPFATPVSSATTPPPAHLTHTTPLPTHRNTPPTNTDHTLLSAMLHRRRVWCVCSVEKRQISSVSSVETSIAQECGWATQAASRATIPRATDSSTQLFPSPHTHPQPLVLILDLPLLLALSQEEEEVRRREGWEMQSLLLRVFAKECGERGSRRSQYVQL